MNIDGERSPIHHSWHLSENQFTLLKLTSCHDRIALSSIWRCLSPFYPKIIDLLLKSIPILIYVDSIVALLSILLVLEAFVASIGGNHGACLTSPSDDNCSPTATTTLHYHAPITGFTSNHLPSARWFSSPSHAVSTGAEFTFHLSCPYCSLPLADSGHGRRQPPCSSPLLQWKHPTNPPLTILLILLDLTPSWPLRPSYRVSIHLSPRHLPPSLPHDPYHLWELLGHMGMEAS